MNDRNQQRPPDRPEARDRSQGVPLHRRGQGRGAGRAAGRLARRARHRRAGLVVCPGLIDASARLREPGFEYKATLESELAAAVAGGVTHLACPPDTDPPLDEPGLGRDAQASRRALNQAHVYPIGALTVGLKGETITEMGELTDAGCIAFSHADAALADTQVMLRALQYAATFGYRVWLRPQDVYLARDGVAHDGEVATRLGLPAIPGFAETIALETIFELVRATGVHVHLARLSTHDGVARVRAAKKAGLPITCDVAIHHVHLCEVDIGWFNANCHLVPPLRGLRDRAALRAGLADGTIDLICSDHTPVDDDAKQLPFAESEPGATGLELLLPLTLKWAARGAAAAPCRAGPHHRRAGAGPRLERGSSGRRRRRRCVHLRSRLALGGRALRRSGARARTHPSSASSWPERSSIPWSGGRSSTRHDRLRRRRLRASRSFHSGEAPARNLRPRRVRRRLASGLRWHVAGCHVGTRAEEVALHLLREILARARVREAQPILVD